MKRVLLPFIAIVSFALAIVSCQKAPFVTLNTPRSFTFTRDGGTQNITFTCNRDWSVSSSESWIQVSPSSGTAKDGEIIVKISCAANTTYDARTATVTVKVEDLTETISISQDTGLGLLVSPTTFDLTNAAQTIEIEVQKNVEYSFSIDPAAREWITHTGTKGLTSEKLTFSIAANVTYGDREGVIAFKQSGGPLFESVVIKQSQTNGLFVEQNTYDVSSEAQTVEIKVKSNVDFTVSVDESSKAWVSVIETKALTESRVVIGLSENEDFDERVGVITIKGESSNLSDIVEIHQLGLSKEPVVVSLSRAGELSNILGEKKNSIINLTIIGDINGDDVYCFRNMKRLRSLSLKDANIVEGGEPFITYGESFSGGNGWGHWCHDCYTHNNDATDLFKGMELIEEILLPTSLERLGRGTFYDCRSLKEITIPQNASYADGFYSETFGACYSMENIYVEDGNEYFMSIDGCLYSQKRKDLLLIPCARTTYILPEAIDRFDCVFAEDNLLEELIFQDYSPELPSYNGFLDNLRNILNFQVSNENSFHSAIDGVLFSKDGKRLHCYPKGRKDDAYIVPSGTTIIGGSSFSNNRTLKRVVLQEGVTDVGGGAFLWCTALEEIEFPSSLKEIGGNAFQDCHSLWRITCRATTPPKVSGFWDKVSEILVPEESIDAYKQAAGWQDYASIIKAIDRSSEYGEKVSINVPSYGKLKSILEGYKAEDIVYLELTGFLRDNDFYALKTLTNIKYLDFSQAVCENNTIPYGAFKDMNRIHFIRYPDTIQHIEDHAFYGCASLRGSIHIPKDVISIGAYAFMYCNKLSGSLVFPGTLTSIGYGAFFGCSSLTGDLILPDNIEVIEKGTFANCNELNGKLKLPKNLKRIEGTSGEVTAFDGCNLSGSLELPNGLEYIGDGAFQGMRKMSGELMIPSSVFYIGKHAFAFCENFSGKLSFPNAIKKVCETSFQGCTSISTIELSEATEEIRAGAFADCSSVSSFVCRAITPPRLGENALSNHSNNRIIYVPSESIEVYKSDPSWLAYADCIRAIEP